ncbi:hypothetical protein [Epibacterium ulvae]|uniref:hypothetical protein n=1 Tax=Epibacterium ulvae TaxID=1156985 RepID=UPI0024921866|nr:hypothetical protein [Epibacterium ulvae]
MSDNGNWSWWVGSCEESYHTECDSREEAVRVAKEHDGAWIVEACKPSSIKVSDYFNPDDFIVRADENAWDDHGDPEGDGPVFDIALEQQSDLQAMVRAAMDAWQEKHGLIFTGWQFSASRNHEYIPADEAEED